MLPLSPAWTGLWDVDQHAASLQNLGIVGDICMCGHTSSDRYCGEEDALLWSPEMGSEIKLGLATPGDSEENTGHVWMGSRARSQQQDHFKLEGIPFHCLTAMRPQPRLPSIPPQVPHPWF